MKRSWIVRVLLEPDCFRSPGDIFLFAEMLDQFLRGFVSETSISGAIAMNTKNSEGQVWSAKMGRKALV